MTLRVRIIHKIYTYLTATNEQVIKFRFTNRALPDAIAALFQSVVTLVIWLEGSAIVGKNSRKPEVATRRLRNSCTAEVKHTSLKYIALHEMLY
jgi:hypothetical protein